MKTKILLFTFLLISSISFSQTINSNWPQGKFKLNVGSFDYTIYLSGQNKFWLRMIDAKGSFNYFRFGDYTVKQDSVFLSLDKSAFPLKAQIKKASPKTTASKTIEIRIDSLDYNSAYGFKIATGNSFRKDELIDFSDSISSDSEAIKQSVKVKLPAADSLYVVYSSYPSTRLTVFALPKNTQEVRLRFGTAFLGMNEVLTCLKGENSNELVMLENKQPLLSFYYVDNVSKGDDQFLVAPKDLPDNGFEFLPHSRFYIDTNSKNKSAYEYASDSELAVKKDSIKVYTSYEEAQRLAKEQNKFLLMYYEKPSLKDDDYYSFQNTITYINAESYMETDYFNKNFILYNVPENDLKRLKSFGVKIYPGTVILAPAGQLLYYNNGKSFYDNQSNFISSSYLFAEKLRLVYNKKVLTDQLKKQPGNKALLQEYLGNIPGNSVFYDDTETVSSFENVEAKKESPLDYTLDGQFAAKCLNDYMSGESSKVDTAKAKMVLDVLWYLLNTKSMNPEGVIYKTDQSGGKSFTPAFDYFIKNYKELSAYTFIDNDYYKQPKTLYVLLSKLINIEKYRANYNNQSATMCKMFVEALPEVTQYELPLFIHKQISDSYDKPFDDKTIALIDQYYSTFKHQKDVPGYTKTLFKKLASDSISYSYANSTAYSYSYSYEADNSSITDSTFIYKTADMMNNAAWHCYQLNNDEATLTKALNWSSLSVALLGSNPYFLDTYAHLLYKLGQKEKAIEQQQKAVDNIKTKRSDFNETEIKMVMDLRRMIAGTLSVDAEGDDDQYYNTPPPPKIESLVLGEVFEKVDVAPVYEGGEKAMKAFIADQLNYPVKALNAQVSGTVIVSFIINNDGSVTNINVDKSVGYGCDEEAKRLVKIMPLWQPGKIKGKPVNVKYTLPVKFELPK